MRTWMVIGLVAALGAGAGLLYLKRQAASHPAPKTELQQAGKVIILPTPPPATPLATEPALTEEAVPPPVPPPQAPAATAKAQTKGKAQNPAPPANPAPANAKPPIQDELARVALSLVGVDAAAEQYWVDAINDPNLSAHERQDLIEDLNEDGFADPRQPTLDDLPLIVSRLQLIEELAPWAMDQVNAEAFQEAYKDLVKMYGRLTQR